MFYSFIEVQNGLWWDIGPFFPGRSHTFTLICEQESHVNVSVKWSKSGVKWCKRGMIFSIVTDMKAHTIELHPNGISVGKRVSLGKFPSHPVKC